MRSRAVIFSPKRLLWTSRIAVLVLAVASAYFVLLSLRTMWTPPCFFGLGIDKATAVISELDPQNASKGFRVGDRVDLAAMPFSARGYLYEYLVEPAGVRIALTAARPGTTQTATIETTPVDLGIDEAFAGFARKIVAIIYILVAVILVWGRPNLMLWGLAVFLMRTHLFLIGDLRSPSAAALIIASSSFIYALGWPGLIVFLARFPENRTSRMTKYWDAFAAVYFLFDFFVQVHDYIPLFTARPVAELPFWMAHSELAVEALVSVALCWKLLRTKGRSPSRSFRWVAAGYGVGILLGWSGGYYAQDVFPDLSAWFGFGDDLVMLAFPLSVAYAVIRHRAFGLGYLANRILVSGAFFVGIVSTIVISIWTASHATSTLGVGFAMFVALLVGMTLRSSPAIVTRVVDRVFLRHRYEAAVSLDALRNSLRGSNDPKRLTDEVATTLGLASLAVFTRVADGGFVRNAAFGWPPGSAWHLLPEEALTRTLDDDGAAIVRVPDDEDDLALPMDDARPRFALAVRRGDRVERAIFVGPQRNGMSLDRDAMRTLHGVFDEAIFA